MARRDWTLIFPCSHDGCNERATYRYSTRRDLVDSFEQKHYSEGRWRCIRHSRPDEVLSAGNLNTEVEVLVKRESFGLTFSGVNSSFVYGPGFKAFAKDFPEGAKIIVSARLVLPVTEAQP